MVYRFNNLENSKGDRPRNLYTLKDIQVPTADQFQEEIRTALDEFLPGTGYVLVKVSGKVFICEKNIKPELNYITHPITYHPLLDKFTV